MPDESAYRELVRVLEQAVQASVTSIGLEYKDRELMVFYQKGPLGLGAGCIAGDKKQAVIEELVNRAGLARKSEGKFRLTLLGKEFEVVVEEYDSFGESAFNLFDKLRVEDDEFRYTFREELRKATNWDLAGSSKDDDALKKRHTEVVRLQGQLLNLRLLEEIDADTYACKAQELRDEETELRLKIERCSRGRNEAIDIAVKAFELSQNLRAKWFAADYVAKRRILEILCLNWKFVGVSLVPEMRKPFDLLAEGLLRKDSRADRI